MPTFGPYETAQRLFQTGVGGLYALKQDDKKVIKVLQPPEGIWAEETIQEEIDGFRLRAKTQKKLAAGSKFWAPIHDVAAIRQGSEGASGGGDVAETSAAEGRSGAKSGAYAVMDRYERSAQSLVDGRVNLNNDDLRHVMSGIMQGLIDTKKIASRPHGNLKPSNVLLTDSEQLAQATVHLADPAPDGALTANSEKKDLADLGRLLYLLVNLRPYDGGTIGKSKDWSELGPNGEDWRKLCNSLLDEHAPAEERDLEQVLPKVQTWTKKPKKNRLPILIGVGMLVLLIGGGMAAYILTRPPKLDFNQNDWEKLTLANYAWFEKFSGQINDDAVRKHFGADPYPTEVLKIYNDAQGNRAYKDSQGFKPSALAKFPMKSEDLAVEPTQDAKTGYAPFYTQEGVKFINSVSTAMSPEHWSLLGKMDQTAKTYQDRGWKKPAAGIRTLIDGAKPPVIPVVPVDVKERIKIIPVVDVMANVEKTIKASTAVTEIDARWTRIQEELAKLPTGDAQKVPLIAALPRFAEQFPRSEMPEGQAGTLEDVTSLATAFNQIEEVLKQLVTELNKPGQEIVYAELAKDPAVQIAENAALTPQSFAGLPAVAKGYVKITDDPRTKTDWSKSLADVQTQYIAVIREANAEDRNLPTLVQTRATLEKQVQDWSAIQPIEKNRTQLSTLVTQATADLAALNKSGGEWVLPYIVDPAAYLAQQQARLASSPVSRTTPVVYAEWQNRHKALLAKTQAAPNDLKNYTRYRAIDAKFNTLEQTYADFDKKIPASVPGLSDIAGTAWDHTVASRVATNYREAALKDLMTNPALKWQDDLPLVADEGYVSYQRQRLAEFDKLRTDALALISDFKMMIERLDKLYLQANEPAQGAPGWRDFFVKWSGRTAAEGGAIPPHALLADAAIANAVKPMTDRVRALIAVDGVSDYAGLTQATASPAAEIALTAWRKLGAVKVSQTLPVLDDEDKAQAALSAQFAKLATAKLLDAPQQQKLEAELAAQRPIRWRRWADTLSSASAVETALDKADAFKVTLTPQTDAIMIYNRAFYGLRKEFKKDLKEPELKPIGQAFINTVGTMPSTITGDAEIKDLIARMTKSLSSAQEDSNTAGAGPKLAKWEEESPREGVKLYHFPSKANARYTLEFVRMQVANKSIYLCTSEMSAGLFFEIVNNYNKFAEIDNTGKPSAKAHWFNLDPSGRGPRVWKITDKKLMLNPDWLVTPPQMGGNPLYPPNATPPNPSADMPMQYLSPWSAMYAAWLLGCRLPTSDEWTAAYQRFEATAPSKDTWNLRGAAYTVQKQHADAFSTKSMPYPDAGIFLPADKMFDPITGDKAKPLTGNDIAKISPTRVTAGAEPYKGSILWFRKVGAEHVPAAPGTGVMHDLVGNVAEFVFDGTAEKPANVVTKTAIPVVAEIETAISTQPMVNNRKQPNLFIVGGSSLSPPETPFNSKLPADPTIPQVAEGLSDVGFRLAYTAPIDSIADVLAQAFREPRYLPGKSAGQNP